MKLNRILKNSLILFFANIAGKIFYFLAIIFIIRATSYKIYGIFAYTLSIVFILSTLLDLGIDKIFIRESSKDRSRLPIIFSLISGKSIIFLVLFLCALLFPFKYKTVLLILLFAIYIKSILNLYLGSIEALQKMENEAKIIFIGNFIFLFLILFLKKNLLFFSISYLMSALIQLLLAIHFSPIKNFYFHNLKEFKRLLFIGIPIGIIIIVSTFEFRLDTLLLKFLINEKSVGLYNSVYIFISFFLLIPNVFTTSFFPHISGIESKRNIFFKTFNYSMLLIGIAFTLILVFTPLSKPLLTLFYKVVSKEQIYTFKVLLLSLVPIFFSAPYIFAFYSKNFQIYVLFIILIKIILNLLLNLHFIPLWGIKGAAWVMFFTEFIGSTLFFTVFLIKFKYD